MNPLRGRSVELIRLLGSPFSQDTPMMVSEGELLATYQQAFKDRVALLLLERYERTDWSNDLQEKVRRLRERQAETISVIGRLARVLNEFDPECYVIFKSIKPYPATPNDTDILFLKGKKEYERAYQYLLGAGYVFHEWAPQQRTIYDPKGAGKIGKGKKGGTYYIDFYEEISTDYFAYFDKTKLPPHIVERAIDGVPVKLLRPEPELAIVLFHNVFPERTFQLEHFYLPLFYVRSEDFDLGLFVHLIRSHRMTYAVRSNFALIAELHRKTFGKVPLPVRTILDQLGDNPREVSLFVRHGHETPYLFSQRTFWISFLQKTLELYCFKSLLLQIVKMTNPVFFIDVVKSLKKRLSERGVYHLE
jgi:hypothetical protein